MSYMEKFADDLGIKLNEEFMVQGIKGRIFRLTADKGAQYRMVDISDEWIASPATLTRLMTGECSILKHVWKPKKDGEEYYFITCNGNIVRAEYGENVYFDTLMVAMGNCYATRSEAADYIGEFDEWLGKSYRAWEVEE